MNVMPIGGKSPDNKVKGVKVDEQGRIDTSKHWSFKEILLMNYNEIRDTEAHNTADVVCDCSNTALTSLRFANYLDTDITVHLYEDGNTAAGYFLQDVNGDYISFVVKQGKTIVTPDDIPALKYIRYLKLRVKADNKPTEGGFSIFAYLKG